MEALPKGKLVRDFIPDIIENDTGTRPETIILTPEQLTEQLTVKLSEELAELRDAKERAHIVEELADVEEVQLARGMRESGVTAHLIGQNMRLNRISDEEVEAARLAKLAKKGGFCLGIYMLDQAA